MEAVNTDPACVVYPETVVNLISVANYKTSGQTLLALSPSDYHVGRCDMSKFMRDPATTDERL